MADEISVGGRLISPNLVELDHPLTGVTDQVTVVARAVTTQAVESTSLPEWLERLKNSPPRNRTREDIKAQIREERDSWDDER